MQRSPSAQVAVAAIICLALPLWSAGGAYRPIDPALLAEEAIEWKDSWQATYDANLARWQQAGLSGDRLQLQTAAMLEAMIQRYQPRGQQLIEACKQLAAHLSAAGDWGRSNYYLGKVAELSVGQVEQAQAALRAVIDQTIGRPDSVEDGLRWLDYAGERLIAMNCAGLLADTSSALASALKARLTVRLRQGRFHEAAETLTRLESIGAADQWAQDFRTNLLTAAGAIDQAIAHLQELARHRPMSLAAERAKSLSRLLSAPADFPQQWSLQGRWRGIVSRSGAADAATVQSLLEDSAQAEGLLPWGQDLHVAMWFAADRLLCSQPPQVLNPFRLAQRQLASPELAKTGPEGKDLLDVFRRYPLAPQVHREMVLLAEKQLRAGNAGEACRWLEDVLAHSSDQDLRLRAQSGLWLALADQARDAREIRTAFEGVDEAAAYPWMGGAATAAQIRAMLTESLSSEPAANGPDLGQLTLQPLASLPVAPWGAGGRRGGDGDDRRRLFSEPVHVPFPQGQLQLAGSTAGSPPFGLRPQDRPPSGQAAIVSGPRAIGCYEPGRSQPAWTRVYEPIETDRSRRRGAGGRPLAGGFVPAVADGRVITRWHAAEDLGAGGLAAFDLADGTMLWSACHTELWQAAQPSSDPAVADGRAYVVMTQGGELPMTPAFLLCLDAATGRTLFQRRLGSASRLLPHQRRRTSQDDVDVCTFGTAPAVHRGWVYCQTNLGFVAKCDGRDGLVQWARSYARSAPADRDAAARRVGAPPIVAGERVIFAPRDYAGVFALDAQTGEWLWQNNLAPSEHVLGLAGDVLLVRDGWSIAALDAASGRVVYHEQFGSPIAAAALAGESVIVATADRLYQIDARRGELLAERPADGAEMLAELAVRGGELVRLSPLTEPLAAAPPEVPAGPLRQELAPTGRPARIVAADPAGNTDGRLYVVSDGMLQCLDAASLAVLWKRMLPAGIRGFSWAKDTLLAPAGRAVLAVDSSTGRARWHAELPFEVRQSEACGEYVLAADLGTRQAAMLSLADGKLLWARQFPDRAAGGHRVQIADFGWDGRALYLIAPSFLPGGSGRPAVLTIDPRTGQMVGVRPFGEDQMPRRFAVTGATCVYLAADNTLCELSLPDGELLRHRIQSPDWPQWTGSVRIVGQWIVIAESGRERNSAPRDWIFRLGDEDYCLVRPEGGFIRGQRLYELQADSVAVVDLPSGKQTNYELSKLPHLVAPCEVLVCLEDALRSEASGSKTGRLWVLSQADSRLPQVRLDVFDLSAGRHLRGEMLSGLGTRGLQLEGFGGGAVLAGDTGLRLLHPPGQGPAAQAYVIFALRSEASGSKTAQGPIRVDGRTDDWAGEPIALDGSDGQKAHLRLAHDEKHLYLAISCPSRWFVPPADGETSAGDWLQLELTTNAGPFRLALAADAAGRAVFGRNEDDLPRGLLGAVRADALRGELTYELAVPLDSILTRTGNWRRMGLSLAVWDDRPRSVGRQRAFVWGAGQNAAGPQAVHLGDLTAAAHQATLALAEELPELDEPFEYFKRFCRMRSAGPQELLGLYKPFVRRHPRSITARRLLDIDAELRSALRTDPGKEIVALAEEASVPREFVERYARMAGTCLSTWVYVQPRETPRSIAIDLHDGQGWGHRVHWGKPPGYGDSPGRIDAIPSLGRWQELRVPLLLTGMEDRPICGIAFLLQRGQVHWDRTAILAGGKEHVLIDDELPDGKAGGTWRWLDRPVHAGRLSHYGASPPDGQGVVRHEITALQPPLTQHIVEPTYGPMLSQWIYIHPDRPAKTIAIALHDGRRWASRLLWGGFAGHGRYMGPLPQAAGWHEIRVPLAESPLMLRPIAGLAFDADGEVFWDRTAIIVDGKETVLIEDHAPGSARWSWRSGFDDRGGAVRPVRGPSGWAMWCDGVRGHLTAPHCPQLEAGEMTVEALVRPDLTAPPGRDVRRWVVSKNGSEWTDGHYGLCVKGLNVAATLNVGGGKENAVVLLSTTNPLADGGWHHLAMTYDGADLRLYVDGAEVASGAINRARKPGSGAFSIGRRADGGYHFAGAIDEVRVFARAMTAEEIRSRAAAAPASAPSEGPASRPGSAVAKPGGEPVMRWSFDDMVACGDGQEGWDWTDKPVKSGRRAHASRGAEHSVLLAEPFVGHMVIDPARAAEGAMRHLAAMGDCEQAWALLQSLAATQVDERRRIGLYRWFLSAMPEHPSAAQALGAALEEFQRLDEAAAKGQVQKMIDELKLPWLTVYRYNRSHVFTARAPISEWQVAGPFGPLTEDEESTAFEPQGRPVRLSDSFAVGEGRISWQVRSAATAMSDLADAQKSSAGVTMVAYAACWLISERAQTVVLELPSGAAGVWLNGRPVAGDATPGAAPVELTLPQGVSELMIKIISGHADWGAGPELVEPLGRQPQGLRALSTPPAP